MSLTRADVEAVLIRRIGKLFDEVGLDGTAPTTGGNPDLNDPIGYAIRQVGGTVDSIALVTNADLGTVDSDDYDQFLDVAEIRAMQSALSAARRLVSIAVGPRREELNHLSDGLADDLKTLVARLDTKYGVSLGTLSAGVITLDFLEEN